ncbi:MAG: SAF domain-containing protein [Bifidobacteriaceae bacterium]|jgi:Flp pilus assembly protein CpaB|nr:SAF domain-containing protein [Bifidobacteriaceae bacterium]
MIDSERRRAARSLLWRLRWALAAVFAAVLIRIALPGIVGAFGAGEAVVLLRHDVTAGAVLAREDVQLGRAPPQLVPDGAFTSDDAVIGGRLPVSLPAGTILHPGLIGQGLSRDPVPAGRVAAAVRLSDPGLAALAAPGDRLDIMASAGAGASGSIAPAQVLARSALVLPSPAAAVDAAESEGSGLLLVAVTPAEAELIGGAAAWAVITAVLVG